MKKDKRERKDYKAAYYAANSDRIAAYQAANAERIAAYRSANKGRIAARMVAYYAANADRIAARKAAHYAANAGRIAAQQSAYRATDAGKMVRRKDGQKRRAIKASATIGDLQAISAWVSSWRVKSKVRCYWCDKQIRGDIAQADHIQPLSKGGPHALENLCIACPKCNNHKNAKPLEDWNAQISEPVLF